MALSQAHPALRKRDVSPEATFVNEIRKLIYERSKSGVTVEPERICEQNDRWDSIINALKAIRYCPANSRVLRCDEETLGWCDNDGAHVASKFDAQVATPLPPASAGQFAVLRLYGSQSKNFGGSHTECRGSIELPGIAASESATWDSNHYQWLVNNNFQTAIHALSLPDYGALATLATTLFKKTIAEISPGSIGIMCSSIFGYRMEDESTRKPTLAAAPCPVQLDQWDQRLMAIIDRFTQYLHHLRECTKYVSIPYEHWEVTAARNVAAWRVFYLAIDELKRHLCAQKGQVMLTASAVEAAYVALGGNVGARGDLDQKLAWVTENVVVHAAERHDTKIENGKTILSWGPCELRLKGVNGSEVTLHFDTRYVGTPPWDESLAHFGELLVHDLFPDSLATLCYTFITFIDPSPPPASGPRNGSEKGPAEREDIRARFSKGGALVASAPTIFDDESWEVDSAALDTLVDRLGTAPFGWSRKELVVLLYAVSAVVLGAKYESARKGPPSPSAKKFPLSPFAGCPIVFLDLKTVPAKAR
ncbi:hypothetical protein HDU86_001501 [Geranomyces michiganensis]|nr:hypothetical protein HDU86_001501 [Geranomyces michiganensis]